MFGRRRAQPQPPAALAVELGDELRAVPCDHCGLDHIRGRGFAYGDGTPYAVYWLDLHEHDAEPGATLLIALGGPPKSGVWAPAASFVVQLFVQGEGVGCMVLGRRRSPRSRWLTAHGGHARAE